MALLATMIVAGPAAVAPQTLPQAEAASGVPVTSTDNKYQLTKTASTSSLPIGGGKVTYTYTIKNTMSSSGSAYTDTMSRFLFPDRSGIINDDKCANMQYVSGYATEPYYRSTAGIAPGGTATFTCTATLTTTTTNTATATPTYYDYTRLAVTRATATVTVAQPAVSCDTQWGITDDTSATTTGNIVQFTSSGATTTVVNLDSLSSSANGYYDSAASLAVSPLDPTKIYYIPRYPGYATANNGLWMYNSTTGTSTQVVANNTPTNVAGNASNRLAMAPDGTLWSGATDGNLYRLSGSNWVKAATVTVTSTGTTVPSGAKSLSTLASGDITFDGLGNMWLIGSDNTSNYLYTISGSSLTSTAVNANYVGSMGTGTAFNGLSFDTSGNLYATAHNGTTSGFYTVNKDKGTATPVATQPSSTIGATTDLASCALPKPELRITKTVGSDTVAPNGLVTYTVTIQNIGTLASTGTSFQDNQITDGTYVSSTLNGTAVGASGVNYWSTAQPVKDPTSALNGQIAPGQSATIQVTVRAGSAPGSSVCNQGTAGWVGAPPTGQLTDNPATSTNPDATCVEVPNPVIDVQKSASVSALQGSGPVTYTYTVTNVGDDPLKTVTLADDKCPSPILQPKNDAAVPPTGDTNGDAILQKGEIWLYSCTSTISTSTTNVATATGTGTLSNLTVKDTATASVTVSAAQINITKTPGTITGPDANGDYVVTYTVAAKNTGNGAGTYGPIQDKPQYAPNLMPTSASWTGAQAGTQALSSSSTPAFSFSMGTAKTLAAGATDTYNMSVTFHYSNQTQALACAGSGTGTYNSVTAAGETGTPSDNVACVPPPAPPTETLSITKTANPTTVSAVGATVAYTFVVKNTGQVTMNSITVADAFTNSPAGQGAMTAITCPATTLAPGASTTCTATYTTAQADLDAGKILNEATATGTPVDTRVPVTTPPVTAEVKTTATPAIDLTKTAATPVDVNKDGLVDAGDTIVYTLVVKNTGAVTLNRPAAGWLNDPLVGNSNITCGASTPNTLAPGASFTCTTNPYVITAADVTSAAVTNKADVTGVPANGTPNVTDTSTVVTPTTTPAPGITVTKAANATTYKLGDTITYTFTVKNTGNVPLSNVTVTDTFSTGGTGVASVINCQTTTLAAGATTTCSMTYVANQKDVDLGKLVNAASVTGTVPPGDGPNPTSPSNTVTLTDAPTSSMTLTKAVAQVTDVDGDGIIDSGDTIVWRFRVENTGKVTLTRPAAGWISDDKLGAGATYRCPAGFPEVTSLAPGASLSCTAAPYTITDADVALLAVVNTATASGTTPTGGTTTSNESSTTTPTDSPAPALSLTKTVADPAPGGNGDGVAQVGETISYSFVVANSGNVTMNGISITEDLFTATGTVPVASCPSATLAAKASMTCTATYKVSQADVDNAVAKYNARITNNAHATGTPQGDTAPVNSNVSTARIPVANTPSLSMDKSVSDAAPGNGDGIAQVGETLTYSFEVTNTGTVTLSRGSGVDTFTQGGAGTEGAFACPSTSLAPDESMTCTMSYVVGAADMDVASLDNVAKATFQDPLGASVTSNEDTATIPTDRKPALSATKTLSRVNDMNHDGITDAGDTITWNVLVNNTGNVGFTSGFVTDPLVTSAGGTVNCPSALLPVGGSMTCSTSPYVVTDADVTAGKVLNVATATGNSPAGSVTTPETSNEVPIVTPQPALTMTKTADKATYAVGDLVTYTFTVSNPGNVPMAGITVSDAFDQQVVGVAGATPTDVQGSIGALKCPSTELAPGASMACTMTYTTEQSDVDAGKIVNRATATGTPPGGTALKTPESSVTLTSVQDPSLLLAKSADMSTYVDVNGNGLIDAGDTVQYLFEVTNTGNITLYNLFIRDQKLGGATAPNGDPMRITCNSPGQLINPGQVQQCVSDPYTLSLGDQAKGSADNLDAQAVAYPAGTVPDEANHQPYEVDSNYSSATVPMQAPTPAITVTKTPSQSTYIVGSPITYTFHVTNPGNVALSNVTVSDAFTVGGTGTVGEISCPSTTLAAATTQADGTVVPGAMDCTMTYTTNQADVDLSKVDNTVTVVGTPPQHVDPATGTLVDTAPVTATDDAEITSTSTVQMTLNKAVDMSKYVDVNNNGLTDAGDTIVYTFQVRNAGNVTMSNLTIADPMFPAGSITCPTTTLAPGETTVCSSAPYAFTSDQQTAGVASNTAVALATPPNSTIQIRSNESSANVPLETPAPSVTITKKADATTFVVGQKVLYTFTVTNTGNQTLTDLAITDTFSVGGVTPVPAFECPTTLVKGASMDCTFEYTATQKDVDGGLLKNTASVVGTPLGNTTPLPPVTSNEVTLTANSEPAITLDKTVSTPVDVNGNGLTDAGDTVVYTFVSTNTGNTTLKNVAITDPTLGTAGVSTTKTCTITHTDATTTVADVAAITLAPKEFVTCTSGTYTVSAADQKAGTVVNTATTTGTPPSGTPPTATDNAVVPVTAPAPSLKLAKTASEVTEVTADGRNGVGDSITYTFTLTNDGNVPQGALSITDTKLAAARPAVSTTAGTCTVTHTDGTTATVADLTGLTLAVGEKVACTSGAYTITQADVDAQAVVNSATATGTPPGGPTTTTPPSTTTTPLTPVVSLSLTKTADTATYTLGQTVTYSFLVKNTGTVTMDKINVTDTFTTAGTGTLSAITCPVTTLSPNAETTCTATYVTTQADVDAGQIVNVATAHGTQPPTTAMPTPAPTDSNTSTVTITSTASPKLDLFKKASSIVDSNGDGVQNAGDTINYTFDVTNSGTVTMSNIAITDTMLGAANPAVTITCTTPAGGLAPTATMTCTATPYTITQADVDAGNVHNAATATGTPPGSTTPIDPSTPSTTDTPIAAAPSITVAKTADKTTFKAGDTITYSFAVANTGNVTLTNVSLADTFTAPATSTTQPTCPTTTLTAKGTAGATMTCTMTYTATQADVDKGSIVNAVTATGNPPTGTPVTGTDTHTISETPAPAISIVKDVKTIADVNANRLTDAGDTVIYTFTVTNDGNVTLTKPTAGWISDDKLGAAATYTCTSVVGTDVNKLAPGDSITCVNDTPYVLTAADQTAKTVTNTATAHGTTPTKTDVGSTPDTATVMLVAPIRKLGLTKAVADTTRTSGGYETNDQLAYTFTVTNTGNVAVDALTITDGVAPDSFSGTGTLSAITCDQTTLAVDAVTTCRASYTVTQADVNAGSIINAATAHGTTPGIGTGPTVPVDSNQATTTITANQTATLTLDKTAGAIFDKNADGKTNAGDTIAYSFLVTNTGTSTITDITVTDDKLTSQNIIVTCPLTTLDAGASTTCTAAPYVLTQADVDAATVVNKATANGTGPGGPVVPPTDTVTTTVPQKPSMGVDKVAGPVANANSDAITGNVGDTIAYTFVVTNTGTVTMNRPTAGWVTDTLLGAGETYTCNDATGTAVTSLAPNASVTCTGDQPYVLTLADVNAGHVANSATTAGTPPTGPDVPSTPDTTDTPITPAPAITVDKTASTTSYKVGDTITYSYLVANTGNVTLTSVGVTDVFTNPPAGAGTASAVTCPVTTLDPGRSTTCTSTYVTTQTDVDTGKIDNTATASGTPPPGAPFTSTDTQEVTNTATSKLDLLKKVATSVDVNADGLVDAGDTITWTFDVTNSGNVTMTNVTIADPTLADAGVAITCPAGAASMAPGVTIQCTSGTYTVTAADVANGSVKNTATATGTPPSGPNTPSNPSETTTTTTQPAPALTVEKSASQATFAAGDTITYSFLVTNTGNVPLNNVNVTDTFTSGGSGTMSAISCPLTTLELKGTTTCTATYVTTQADVDKGSIDNAAVAHGTQPPTTDNPTPTPTDSTPDTETVTNTATPELALDKAAGAIVDANGDKLTNAGDTIAYTFTVTNNGNVTVSNLVVQDAMLSAAGVTITCPVTSLSATASTVCTATAYTLTQADVDAAHVANTATVTGTTPNGGTTTTPPDGTDTPVPATPALTLTKTADTTTYVLGQTVKYSFLVTNTGNVTMSNLTVTDQFTTGGTGTMSPITCPTTTLAPKASTTCTATYVTTQADVDAARIVNAAVAHGTQPPTTTTPTPPVTDTPTSTVTITDTPAPELTLVKKAGAIANTNGNAVTGDAGDTIAYTFDVTNSGNVTMDAIAVVDPMLAKAGVTITCPVSTLAPLASTTCTASAYTLTQADVDAGKVDNAATAQGTPPGSTTPVPSEPSTTSTPITPALALTIVKTADKDTFAVGDTITYSFLVTNTGSVTLTNVNVTDKLTAPALDSALSTITCPATEVASMVPGASTTCTATYVATQADVDAGKVVNTAIAHGTPPATTTTPTPTPVDSTPSTETVSNTPAPALTLTKSVASLTDTNSDALTDEGDQMTWNFLVTNTGNVTLSGITVADPMLATAGVTITCPVTTLAPNASTTCTSTVYSITAADVTAGQVANTATAHGTTPTVTSPDGTTTPGTDVPSNDSSTTTPVVAPKPALSLVKTADTTTFVVGQTITYSFAVKNTGNVALASVNVTDTFSAPATGTTVPTCLATSLAVGESTTCSLTYTTTQADVDAGKVINTATAHGTPPNTTTPVDSTPSTVTLSNTPAPSLSLVKKVASVTDANGDGLTDSGDTITWTFDVTNTGNVTMSSITVADPMLEAAGVAITCPATTLAPGAVTQCTSAEYSVTSTDVSVGQVANTATAHGITPTTTNPDGSTTPGTDVPSNPSSTTTPTTAPAPSLSLVKTADNTTFAVGGTITYSFLVTNTGNVTLNDVNVTDTFTTGGSGTMSAITCPLTTLPVKGSTTCVATYVTTQADVDAGRIVNAATAHGTQPPTGDNPTPTPTDSTPDDHTVSNTPNPAMTLAKDVLKVTDTNADALTNAGDTMTWTFLVTNTGNVTLSGITVDDPTLAAAKVAVTCPVTTLAPGASTTCTSAVYTITAADETASQVHNVATAKGTPPVTPSNPTPPAVVTPPSETTTPVVPQAPSMTLVKSVASTTGKTALTVGDTLKYSFLVTNTGNVALHGIAVTDTFTSGGTGSMSPITCPTTALEVDGSTTCTATYVVTQADVDNGTVKNTAKATGTTPDGKTVTPPDSKAEFPGSNVPKLTLVKTAGTPVDTNADGLTNAGDTIAWSFAVTNSGNVTLSNVSVDDAFLEAANVAITCPVTTLAPGASTVCTSASYTITAADEANGSVKNTATAHGTTPPSDGGTTPGTDVPSNESETTTPLVPEKPSMALVKSVASTTGKASLVVGDTLEYSFLVTNTGNVTITGLSVSDAFTSGGSGAMTPITCPSTTLTAAGTATATTTCTATYVVTQSDVDLGLVVNTATATGKDPNGGDVTTPPSDAKFPGTSTPALSLVKKAGTPVDVNADGLTDAGDQLTFTFTVTNTGNVTLNQIGISDPMLEKASVAITCGATGLLVGASTTCTSAPYTITDADVTAGKVANVATAHGTPPGTTTPVSSPPSDTTTPTTPRKPSIALVKSVASTTGKTSLVVGDKLTYTFAVTNTGNVEIGNIAVTDTFTQGGTGTMSAITCPTTTLPVGGEVDCTATYTVVQADVDAGVITNTATATGTPKGSTTPVTTPPSDVRFPGTSAPDLTLVKSVKQVVDTTADGLTNAGDTITWSFVVTNTGNVTLGGIAVDDAMLKAAGVAVTCPVTTLAPAAATTCTSGAYTITAAEEKAGKVANVATAQGTPPGATTPVVSPKSPTETPLVPPAPKLVLNKYATNADPTHQAAAQVGDKVTWHFELSNTGNVALATVGVDDPMLSKLGLTVTCEATSLAAGATTTCVSEAYTVTEADVKAGQIQNTATAHGTPPGGTSTPSNPSTAIVPTASIGLYKSAKSVEDTNGDGIIDAGDQIVWQFLVTNNGSSELTDVTVSDADLASRGVAVNECQSTTLAPGASTTCLSDPYTITAEDQAAGRVHNTATATGTVPGSTPTPTPSAPPSDQPSGNPTPTPSSTPVDPGSPTPTPSTSTGPSPSPTPTATPTGQPTTPAETVTSPPSEWTIPVFAPEPSITIVKSVKDASGNGTAELGEKLTYSFVVTNTGNVTLAGVGVDDKMVADVTCPTTTLKVGATTTCTGVYVTTQADVDNGKIVNTATSRGHVPGTPDVPVTSTPSTAVIVTPNDASISLVKKAALADTDRDGGASAGEQITYTFVITNIGKVTLHDLSLVDARLDMARATYSWPGGHELVPGASMTVTASPYTVTAGDVAGTEVANTATTTGLTPEGTPVRSTSNVTTPVVPKPVVTPTPSVTPTPEPTPTPAPTPKPSATPAPVPPAPVPPAAPAPKPPVVLGDTGSEVNPLELVAGVLSTMAGLVLVATGRRRRRD